MLVMKLEDDAATGLALSFCSIYAQFAVYRRRPFCHLPMLVWHMLTTSCWSWFMHSFSLLFFDGSFRAPSTIRKDILDEPQVGQAWRGRWYTCKYCGTHTWATLACCEALRRRRCPDTFDDQIKSASPSKWSGGEEGAALTRKHTVGCSSPLKHKLIKLSNANESEGPVWLSCFGPRDFD